MAANATAFVFPGQGSQKIGMLAEAHAEFEIVRDTFAEASEVLGYDLWDLIQNGEQEALNLTETTQPALLTSSVAIWRAWQELGGLTPALVAGHSLGEFSALVCAGSLGFRDAVALVRKRGEFMQSAVPVGEGAMVAIIGLDDESINRICAQHAHDDAVVAAVNFNSPGQVVIAGHVAAVESAAAAMKEAGAKRALPLPVSAPFHTELMKPAGERLAEAMAGLEIRTPEIPVVHNVHAQTEADPERIRILLVEQIFSPVEWTRCVRTMVSKDIEHIVECGPGRVLSGLNRRIDKSLQSHATEAPEALRDTFQAIS